MPTLVVRQPDGTEQEYEVTGELKLGRQQGSDILLTEGGVSRTHAVVYEEDGTVFIEDKASANGTFVDGERIMGPTALTPQAEVVLGDYTLRLKAAAPPRSTGARRAAKAAPPPDDMPVGAEGAGARSTRAIPSMKRPPAEGGGAALAKRPARPKPAGGPAPAGGRAAAGGPGPGPMLRGMVGPWTGKTYPLKGKVLVGRQAPAPVLLEDDSVSRRHAELEATAEGVTVRDLGSANGTLLNGEPLGTEPVTLMPGDQLQFGVVEMTFEADEVLDAPVRRSGASSARGRDPEVAAAPPAGRKKLLVVAGGAVALLMVAAVAKSTLSGPMPVDPGAGAVGSPEDPGAKIQALLSECRSFASSDLGSPPNWARAEQTCTEALNLDPIHPEANTLIRRIKLEKEAEEYFTQGEKLLARLKPDEALASFRKIPKESEYFRKARSKAREAAEEVTKRALDDCKQYLRDSQWSAAVPRCQQYMAVWCQKQPREALQPPLGYTLKLEGPVKKKKNEWRPTDKLFVSFLIARQKVDPAAAPWVCPVAEVLNEDERPTDPRAVVEAAVKKRFTNKFMQAAMMDYWSGRGSEAFATLRNLRSNYEAAQFHAQVDEMLRQMSTVDQLYKNGGSHLNADDPEKAAEPFREALAVDKELMVELAESKPSFYRRSMLQDMADKSYARGKHWADREDKRRACRVWKLGFGFYAGNPDLNKAVGFCSNVALQSLRAAGGCPDLAAVLDYAVKGDGVEELVVEKKKEWSCP